MRAVLQRVSKARVTVESQPTGEIGAGWLVLLGVSRTDTLADAAYLAEKTMHLRAFPDEEGRMNRSVVEAGGQMLVVSQFTLYGDCRKGRRPGFSEAAAPEKAQDLYEAYIALLRQANISVATGRFQAHMDVELSNDGPVTFILDSSKQF